MDMDYTVNHTMTVSELLEVLRDAKKRGYGEKEVFHQGYYEGFIMKVEYNEEEDTVELLDQTW